MIRERFTGRHFARLDPGWSGADFAAAVEAAGFGLVIFDSVREMLLQLGLSEDKTDDFSRLYGMVGSPLAERDITPVFLDNVGHNNTDRPRGASGKLDAIPQGYGVTTDRKFSPAERGSIRMVCQRSRYGDEGLAWRMDVGGGTWGLPEADTKVRKLLAHLPGEAWRPQTEVAEAMPMSRQALAPYIEAAERAGAIETEARERGAVYLRRIPDYSTGGLAIT